MIIQYVETSTAQTSTSTPFTAAPFRLTWWRQDGATVPKLDAYTYQVDVLGTFCAPHMKYRKSDYYFKPA